MMRLSTGCQCRSLRIGVARAYLGLHETRRAAQFWTACSRWIRYFGRPSIWIESVDPVADLCLTNQIYSLLLWMLLNSKKSLKWKILTFKCFWKMKRELVVASTRHHRARFLKYYPRLPCPPSRMLRQLQAHFLLFQQIFFILVCIHPRNPRVPTRVLASGPKPRAGAIKRNHYWAGRSGKKWVSI